MIDPLAFLFVHGVVEVRASLFWLKPQAEGLRLS